MQWFYWIRACFRRLFGGSDQELELKAELDSYLELAIQEKCRKGVSRRRARREALIELGGVESTKQQVRERRAGAGLERCWQDLRFGFRLIFRNPGFSLAVLLTLALGVGANSAIYSLAEAVLFRSPAVAEPQDLVAIWTTCRLGQPRCSSSYPDYLDYRSQASSLQDLAAYTWQTASLGGGGEAAARIVTTQLTTGNYFSLLGVGAALGRPLLESDEEPEARQVAVLSHSLWRSQFAGDPQIVGRTVRLNRRSFEVVGVAPAGFSGLHLGEGPDIFVPLLSRPVLATDPAEETRRFSSRGSRWIAQLIGRKKQGVSLLAVREEMTRISDRLAEQDPEARGPRTITVDSATEFLLPVGSSSQVIAYLLLLGGVVGSTLLLACANLSNLLLARGLSRRQEMAIRGAVGAGRWRLIRQQITETLLLACLGGMFGLAVARLLLGAIGSFELPGGVTIASVKPELNWSVLLVTFVVALLSGVLAGLVPALQGTRPQQVDVLAQGGGRVDTSASSKHWRRLLIGVQLALSLVLLVGAAVFLETLQAGLSADLGFRSQGLVTAQFDLSLLHYSQAEAQRLLDELSSRVEAFPGVESSGVGTRLPLQSGGSATFLRRIEGYTPAPDEELRINYEFFKPGFVATLGIPLIAGETLAQAGAPDVVLINRDMAERWWSGRNPVGGQFQLGNRTLRVAGVIENVRWRNQLDQSSSPMILLRLPEQPASSDPVNRSLFFFARTSGDEQKLELYLREVLHEIDPGLSLNSLATMQERLRQILQPQQMAAFLFTSFGILGLLLAAIGIYGVTSFTVGRRFHEIGIRLAMGAPRPQILWLMLRQLAVPVCLGVAAGILLTQWLAGSAEGFLVGDTGVDSGMILVALATLFPVVLLACLIPASRAARMDPLAALRTE